MVEERFDLPNNWTEFICTHENMADIYSRLMQFPLLFDDSVRGSYDHFVSGLVDPNSIVVKTGDYGICKLSNVLPGREATIHLTFWDKRFRGRADECRQAIRWAFQQLDLVRLSIHIPAIARNTQHFAKALGFTREGVIRDGWLYKGKFMNLHLFGMLRSEAFSMNTPSEGDSATEDQKDGREEG